MARALIVGCGCCGRELGRALAEQGWQVRGTTRAEERLAPIEEAGVEAVVADPDRIGTVLERIDGVTLIFWLLGSVSGAPETVEPLHGDRLERLLEEIVDTPVRGFVYELANDQSEAVAARTFAIFKNAGERWRIPYEIVAADRADLDQWLEGMLAAARELIG